MNDGSINDGEDLAMTWHDMTWGNLETKYCGEAIGDGVQLWTKTGDVDEPNDVARVTGEKQW